MEGNNGQTATYLWGVLMISSDREKICTRCLESWPDDEEFYWKPADKTCRACKYEVKKAQHDRDPNRKKSSETSA